MNVKQKIDEIIDRYLPEIELWVRYVNRFMLDVTFYYMKKFAEEIKNE